MRSATCTADAAGAEDPEEEAVADDIEAGAGGPAPLERDGSESQCGHKRASRGGTVALGPRPGSSRSRRLCRVSWIGRLRYSERCRNRWQRRSDKRMHTLAGDPALSLDHAAPRCLALSSGRGCSGDCHCIHWSMRGMDHSLARHVRGTTSQQRRSIGLALLQRAQPQRTESTAVRWRRRWWWRQEE